MKEKSKNKVVLIILGLSIGIAFLYFGYVIIYVYPEDINKELGMELCKNDGGFYKLAKPSLMDYQIWCNDEEEFPFIFGSKIRLPVSKHFDKDGELIKEGIIKMMNYFIPLLIILTGFEEYFRKKEKEQHISTKV